MAVDEGGELSVQLGTGERFTVSVSQGKVFIRTYGSHGDSKDVELPASLWPIVHLCVSTMIGAGK